MLFVTSMATAANKSPHWVVLEGKSDCLSGPPDVWDACKHRDWTSGSFRYLLLEKPQDCDFLKDSTVQVGCKADLQRGKDVYATSDSMVTQVGQNLTQGTPSKTGAVVTLVSVGITIGVLVYTGIQLIMMIGSLEGAGR